MPYQTAALNDQRRSAVFSLVSLRGFFSILIVSLALVGCSDRNTSDDGDKHVPIAASPRSVDDGVRNKIIAIAAGYDHSLALTGDGKVYWTGSNHFGRLDLSEDCGVGSAFFTQAPPLSDKSKIIAIAAGGDTGYVSYSLALDSDGKVYGAGRNDAGQLGLGDKTSRSQFTEISSLKDKKIIAIAAGYMHSLALDSDGKVYGAGWNGSGQLGLSDNRHETERVVFTEVSSLKDKKIIAIAAGYMHSLALDSDGKVYGTGNNIGGQLGLGDKTGPNVFTEVSSLSDKGKIIAIAAGRDHSLALDSYGKVYGTGSNRYGQLGLGDSGWETARVVFTEVLSLSDKGKIIAIAAGDNHSLALGGNDNVYATGHNWFGELGLGDKTNRVVFTEVSSLSDKGKIVAIAAGRAHSLALANDGKVYGAGWNEYGLLGLGDSADREVFVFTEAEFNQMTQAEFNKMIIKSDCF